MIRLDIYILTYPMCMVAHGCHSFHLLFIYINRWWQNVREIDVVTIYVVKI